LVKLQFFATFQDQTYFHDGLSRAEKIREKIQDSPVGLRTLREETIQPGGLEMSSLTLAAKLAISH